MPVSYLSSTGSLPGLGRMSLGTYPHIYTVFQHIKIHVLINESYIVFEYKYSTYK